MTGDLDNETLDVSLMHRTRRSNWFVYVAFLFPALAGFLFGYDIGGASGAVRSLDVKSNATSGIPLNDVENALYTSHSAERRRKRALHLSLAHGRDARLHPRLLDR